MSSSVHQTFLHPSLHSNHARALNSVRCVDVPGSSAFAMATATRKRCIRAGVRERELAGSQRCQVFWLPLHPDDCCLRLASIRSVHLKSHAEINPLQSNVKIKQMHLCINVDNENLKGCIYIIFIYIIIIITN